MKKVKPHTIDWAQIGRFLASADKKPASAHKIFALDEEACLQEAYEAMLKASLGFIFSPDSVREVNRDTHIAIIDFVRSRIDKKHSGLLTIFDRFRRKRNLALYDDTGFISQHDAEQALEAAGNSLTVIRGDMRGGNRRVFDSSLKRNQGSLVDSFLIRSSRGLSCVVWFWIG